uniref:Uncharacterized protein n=1 Tax=Janibacter limosus TaxID=53458 RepID=A0AC61U6J2_9MICO|nr:hypothetical protein [Janibacter limosus]
MVLGDAVAKRLDSLDALEDGAARAGTYGRRVREALRWIRVGSASPMETRSRVLCLRGGLPEPELNAPIHDADGGWLVDGDLVWREAKVPGEYRWGAPLRRLRPRGQGHRAPPCGGGGGLGVRRLHQGRLLPTGSPDQSRRPTRGCCGRRADASTAGRGRTWPQPVGPGPRTLHEGGVTPLRLARGRPHLSRGRSRHAPNSGSCCIT